MTLAPSPIPWAQGLRLGRGGCRSATGWVPLRRIWPARRKGHQAGLSGDGLGQGWWLGGICLWARLAWKSQSRLQDPLLPFLSAFPPPWPADSRHPWGPLYRVGYHSSPGDPDVQCSSLTRTLRDRRRHYPRCTGRDSGAQRGKASWPRSEDKWKGWD